MLDLGRADAVSECAERAVRAGMAVAANQRHAGQRKALFRPDDVDDALALVEFVEIFEPEQLGVLGQVSDLRRALGIGIFLPAIGRRHVVIDHAQRLVRRMHFAAGKPQAFEGLRACHLMHEVPVDIDEAGAVRLFVDEVIVPDFVVERTRLRH